MKKIIPYLQIRQKNLLLKSEIVSIGKLQISIIYKIAIKFENKREIVLKFKC
jgi:hypothetical protein